MLDLSQSLRDTDNGMLPALAEVWGINPKNKAEDDIREALLERMHDEDRAGLVFDMLTDEERGALSMVVTSRGRKMQLSMFEIPFGKVRKMGRGQIEREQPHRNPANVAEALFYRGLIFFGFEQAEAGIRQMVFVPDELLAVLPMHRTQYDNLPDEVAEDFDAELSIDAVDIEAIEEDELENVRPADTSLVDDMTTFLAYLRLYGAGVEGDSLLPTDVDKLLPHMLVPDHHRLDFMLGVGVATELIVIEEGRAHTNRAGIQKWLTAERSKQLKALVDAWQTTTLYQDLWHVPGLHPEPTGWSYDPVLARSAIRNFIIQMAPDSEWWSIGEFIDTVRVVEADFMRPGGDFDSWYIRNDDGEYLHGIESWDAVEGALIEFMLTSAMHWLGLCDMATEAVRFNSYGRAYLAVIDRWPTPPEPTDTVTVNDDGTLTASRKVSRVDRFQLARFTSWAGIADDQYVYQLDADGIRRAQGQGITTAQIASFIQRATDGQPIPKRMAHLLETWQGGGATTTVTLEKMTVLQTNTQDVTDRIFNEPALRRYVRAKLGPMALAVREDQIGALRQALGEIGIAVDD